MMYNNFGYGFGFGGFFMILFWVFIILVLVKIIRCSFRHGGCGHKHWEPDCCQRKGSGAEDILKERYAKGEITKEQFEEMKNDINK